MISKALIRYHSYKPFPRWLSSGLDFIRFRTTRRFNRIEIPTLKPDYHDIDTRLLHGMFALLVEYVEKECAWMEWYFGEKKLTFCQRLWGKFVGFNSKELGLRRLDEEIALDDDPESCQMTMTLKDPLGPSQSEAAKEVKELYLWWTEVYSNRLDWHDQLTEEEHDILAEGRKSFRKFGDGDDNAYDCETEEYKAKSKALMEKIWDIEQSQRKEDEDMLIRLVKIRECLWT